MIKYARSKAASLSFAQTVYFVHREAFWVKVLKRVAHWVAHNPFGASCVVRHCWYILQKRSVRQRESRWITKTTVTTHP
jgi:hypothetical protein